MEKLYAVDVSGHLYMIIVGKRLAKVGRNVHFVEVQRQLHINIRRILKGKMYNKRVEVGDVIAMFNLGCFYSKGLYGVQRNRAKALELRTLLSSGRRTWFCQSI